MASRMVFLFALCFIAIFRTTDAVTVEYFIVDHAGSVETTHTGSVNGEDIEADGPVFQCDDTATTTSCTVVGDNDKNPNITVTATADPKSIKFESSQGLTDPALYKYVDGDSRVLMVFYKAASSKTYDLKNAVTEMITPAAGDDLWFFCANEFSATGHQVCQGFAANHDTCSAVEAAALLPEGETENGPTINLSFNETGLRVLHVKYGEAPNINGFHVSCPLEEVTNTADVDKTGTGSNSFGLSAPSVFFAVVFSAVAMNFA